MPTEKPRVTITMSKDQLSEIEDFRFSNKMKNQTQAILYLMQQGLTAFEDINKQKKSPAPADAETGDARLDVIIACWHELNEDGKESLYDQAIYHRDSSKYKKCNDLDKMA